MWIRNKTAIHTTKFAAKNYEKKNTETHLVQPTFQLKCKTKRAKNVFAINRHTFPPANKLLKICNRNIIRVS